MFLLLLLNCIRLKTGTFDVNAIARERLHTESFHVIKCYAALILKPSRSKGKYSRENPKISENVGNRKAAWLKCSLARMGMCVQVSDIICVCACKFIFIVSEKNFKMI